MKAWMINLILVAATALARPADCMAKAYFAPLNEMIREADAIAIVEITAIKAAKPEEEKLSCRNMVAAMTVHKTVVGNLTGVGSINIDCWFPCAVVRVTPGRFLVFLERQDEAYSNSNWHISLRPVTKMGVEWFDEANRKQSFISIEELSVRIQSVRSEK